MFLRYSFMTASVQSAFGYQQCALIEPPGGCHQDRHLASIHNDPAAHLKRSKVIVLHTNPINKHSFIVLAVVVLAVARLDGATA